MLVIINNIAFSKEIPVNVKNEMYDRIKNGPPFEIAAWGFDEYFIKKEYHEDLINLFKHIVKSNEMPNISKAYIYCSLIEYGYFDYLQEVITLKNVGKNIKLNYLGLAFKAFHFYTSENRPQREEEFVEYIYSLSFNSYKNANHTPDLILDGDVKTSWRINNIKNKDECTLFMNGQIPYQNNIKILIGNHENKNSYSQYFRPKTIIFYVLGDRTKEIIIKKSVKLEDKNEFQSIKLNLGFIQSLTFKEKDVYYTIKMEIIDFYKGVIPQCDIAELHVEPIDK